MKRSISSFTNTETFSEKMKGYNLNEKYYIYNRNVFADIFLLRLCSRDD